MQMNKNLFAAVWYNYKFLKKHRYILQSILGASWFWMIGALVAVQIYPLCGQVLNAYYDSKILENDPFAKLDQNGVGKLMDMSIKLGKPVNPKMHVGICGEHGGDPSSVEFCHKIGLDYVSCSPFRVPIARLAAAQAAINQK